MIDKINHYSLTNPASVYDEEAMTALELAGRTAAKVNDCVENFNELETANTLFKMKVDNAIGRQDAAIDKMINEDMPAEVKSYIESGEFDEQIDEYAGKVENRIDNLFNGLNDGSTTMDAELLDIRLDAEGKSNFSAGLAVRNNFAALNEVERARLKEDGAYTAFSNTADNRISGGYVCYGATAARVGAGYKFKQIATDEDGFDSYDSGWQTDPYPLCKPDGNSMIVIAHDNDSSISPTEFSTLMFDRMPEMKIDNVTLQFGYGIPLYNEVASGVVRFKTFQFNRTRISTAPFSVGRLYRVKTSSFVQVKATTMDYVDGKYTNKTDGEWLTELVLSPDCWYSLNFRYESDNMITSPSALSEDIVFEKIEYCEVNKHPALADSGFYDFVPRTHDGTYKPDDSRYFSTFTNNGRTVIIESEREFAIHYVNDGVVIYDSGWITGRHTIPHGMTCHFMFNGSFVDLCRNVKVTDPVFDRELAPYLATVEGVTVGNEGYTTSYKRFVTPEITLEKPLYIYNRKGFANISYHIWKNGVKTFDSGWHEFMTLPAGVPLRVFFKGESDTVQIWELADICKRPIYPAARLEGVKSIAHRGLSSQAPENTLAAFKAAKAHGFTYVECDVRFTSDGVPVLVHDETIDRTSNGSGSVAGMTYATLSTLDFGSWFNDGYAGEKIVTLEEFLAWCRASNIHPYIEVKDNGDYMMTRSVFDLVKKYSMQDKATIIGGTGVYYELIDWGGNIRFGLVAREYDSEIESFIGSSYSNIFINCDWSGVGEDLIYNCMLLGVPVEVWTVDYEDAIKNLDPYISGVTSNKLIAANILEKEI